jgi:[glutamine synthetase] adenylyltransferase / [glutamine synthetase]-adenylyl-L-tyrosine phosphorylase
MGTILHKPAPSELFSIILYGIIFSMDANEEGFPDLKEFFGETEAPSLFQKFGFSNWTTAQAVLRRIEARDRQGLLAVFPFLITALGSAADPDRCLGNFERLFDGFGPKLFQELEKNPRIIEILITLFSNSPFLTEILFRTPAAIEFLGNRQALTERKTIEQFFSEAISETQSVEADVDKLDALRRYQRRQYLRIGTSDFLGLYDLRTVFSQLSRMAIGLVRACLVLAANQTHISPSGFVVMAMGKLGGWELNYSSDIDLLFVAKKDTETYIRLAKKLIENIASTKSEGFLYRVDLRLRPWGKDGPLIITLDGYLQYIKQNARLWEKQAFLKARPIAGNISFGEELRKNIEPHLFQAPADEVRASIFAMKQRTEEFLQKKGRCWGEVKLGEGSIRDVEFVVQSLQMTHPSIRTRATLKAIPGLQEAGFLTAAEAHILTDGYQFLRTIEHYLQMIDYQQTYTLPSDPIHIAELARRLGFEGTDAGERFVERYEQSSRAIRSIFLKYVGNEPGKDDAKVSKVSPQTLQHMARMDTSYSASFSLDEIQQHASLAAKLDSESVAIVDVKPLDNIRWHVTVVGYDFLGELSLICGLLFVYGLDIIESRVFTYEPIETGVSNPNELDFQGEPKNPGQKSSKKEEVKYPVAPTKNPRRKIVDVFIVRSVRDELPTPEMWARYEEDLHALLIKMQAGLRREARGELAKRVGEMFQGKTGNATPLYPIDIDIDNDSSELYTILRIGTPDTVGFLYEFSNALAYHHINISRMFVQSIGNRVNDMIYVTAESGNKITSHEKQRELRAAIVLIKHFTHLLPYSPNPELALLHFREFLSQLFDRPNWPDELVKLEQPEVLSGLAKLLGVSDFLWDDFLRMQYSNLFPVVRDVDALASAKNRRQLKEELEISLKRAVDWRTTLNAFKDREMFRIDMRHILGYTREFWDFSDELTDLVEVVIADVFRRCKEELHQVYGKPLLENGCLCPSTIFALGKCGGRELGFASDIELMLIYAGKGTTTGPGIIPISEFHEELVRSFVKSIQARQEGIFHIDLQLRPYGKAGSLAVTLDAFRRYFSPGGAAWAYERQALIKLRPIAGDERMGEEVCELRDEYLYTGEPFNVTEMRAMRERQVRHLVVSDTFNAKYSPGGLVDLEYLVQGLQISYGANNPSLRLSNTRLAMAALAKAGILLENDHSRLRKAHTFLRWLIDSLRVVRGNSKDVNIPPYDTEEFAFLTRRLRYGQDTDRLQEDLGRYSTDVQEINKRLLSALQ